MVLGKLPVPGRPTIWITVGQGPTALAVGAVGGWFGHFYSHLSFLYSFSLSLGETARYRLKYCLKGPLNPKQPTNHGSFRYSAVLCWFSVIEHVRIVKIKFLCTEHNERSARIKCPLVI